MKTVVNYVGAALLVSLVGIFALLLAGRDVPAQVWVVPSSILTGLLGLLVRSPDQSPTDSKVTER